MAKELTFDFGTAVEKLRAKKRFAGNPGEHMTT